MTNINNIGLTLRNGTDEERIDNISTGYCSSHHLMAILFLMPMREGRKNLHSISISSCSPYELPAVFVSPDPFAPKLKM